MTKAQFLGSIVVLALSSIAAAQAGHPHLLFTPQKIAVIRAQLGGPYKAVWQVVQQRADLFTSAYPPSMDVAGRQRSALGSDNWQMYVAASLPYVASAYLMTGQSKYLDAAKQRSLAVCAYPHWGRDNDLEAGYCLFGIAMVFDWLYADLDRATRDTLRQTLLERGQRLYRMIPTSFWTNWELQNHQWVALAGLAAAGFALTDDPKAGDEARQWTSTCLRRFQQSDAELQPDGSTQEGMTYWSLGIDGMLKFWALAEHAQGQKPSSSWWAQTGYYRLYLSLPRHAWTKTDKVVDFGDCLRYDWCGPDYLIHRLAQINHDQYLQWFGNESQATSAADRFSASWLNLVWLDPTLSSIAPTLGSTPLPTLRYFKDMDVVSARSDWSGDESLLALKCGPALGHRATQRFDHDPGAAHAHPDAAQFVFFAHGQWLLRDDGYRFKSTENHNTLLIDGHGQLGENETDTSVRSQKGEWFGVLPQLRAKSNPHVVSVRSTPHVDYIEADATEAYPKELGLKRFNRRLLFVKSDVVIVADDVQTTGVKDLELRYHPEYPATVGAGALVSRGPRAALRIAAVDPDGATVTSSALPAKDYLRPALAMGIGRDGSGQTMHTVRLAKRGDRWHSVVVFSCATADAMPARVTCEHDETGWTFVAKSQRIKLPPEGPPKGL